MENNLASQDIVVRDIKMRFGSMVIFMVKWAIAAIPALIILVFLTIATTTVAAGFFASLLFHPSSPKSIATTSPSPTAASESSDRATTTPTDAAAAAYLANLVVRDVKVGQSALDEPAVWGEVKNTGSRTLKRVEIVIYCLGPDGKPVFEKSYSPVLVTSSGYGDDNEPLKAGYSRKFGVKLDDAPSDWTKKVEVKVTSVEFE